MARVYEPKPWTSNSGMSFDFGLPVSSQAPERRRLLSESGQPVPLGVRLTEEYQAHRGYYRFLIAVGVFVLIIMGLVVASWRSVSPLQ